MCDQHITERPLTMQNLFKARWGVAHDTLTDPRPPHYALYNALYNGARDCTTRMHSTCTCHAYLYDNSTLYTYRH